MARRFVGRVRRGSVTWVRERSQEAGLSWKGAIDFLLVDGEHTFAGVRRDWEAWSRHVRPGGLAVVHNDLTRDSAPHGAALSIVEWITSRRDGWAVAEEVETFTALRRS